MALQQKKQNNKAPNIAKPQNKVESPAKPQIPSSTFQGIKYNKWPVIAIILALTFAAYFPSLQNGMLKTWDDQAYVNNNPLIKSISGAGVAKIFKEDRGLYANYHPLTTLSLAINYQFSKDKPFGYHFTNLILHLLNTLLVFFFIFHLSKNNLIISSVSALLFGLNPIHVESVAWISERKDVLYSFFFLASIIAYQKFLQKSNWKLYALSLFLFLCSMLSKAMAASLPLVLILIGYFEARKWQLKLLLDKIPYFIIALALGYYAITIQAEGNAIGSVMFPLAKRILHASFGYSAYLYKILIPINLAAFYPYPYPLVNSGWITNTIPPSFYITFLTSLAIFCFSIFALLSKQKNLNIIGFGVLFYTFTIALVLQFLPVGRAIMADRYAYIPSIGMFFVIGYFANLAFESKTKRGFIITVMALYSVLLFIGAFKQSKVWKNDETLWSHTINIYPNDNRIALVYENRALYYQIIGKTQKALADFLKVADWNPRNDNTLAVIGKIYGKDLNDIDASIHYFEQAFSVNPNKMNVIQDLATAYGIKGNFNKSLEYSLKGLQIDDKNAFLLFNAGITYTNMGQTDLGKQYLSKATELDPTLSRK